MLYYESPEDFIENILNYLLLHQVEIRSGRKSFATIQNNYTIFQFQLRRLDISFDISWCVENYCHFRCFFPLLQCERWCEERRSHTVHIFKIENKAKKEKQKAEKNMMEKQAASIVIIVIVVIIMCSYIHFSHYISKNVRRKQQTSVCTLYCTINRYKT